MREICVTGGTGLIATYLIKVLLEKGYHVRATVRDPGNLENVRYLWGLCGAKEMLKLVKADLMEEGIFDEAVDGVEGVFHTASPVLVPYDSNIQESLLDPCIKGTVNVLKSCSRSKCSIKRVVLTSSCSAIRYRADAQQVSPLSESHWSDAQYCRRHNVSCRHYRNQSLLDPLYHLLACADRDGSSNAGPDQPLYYSPHALSNMNLAVKHEIKKSKTSMTPTKTQDDGSDILHLSPG